MCDREFKVSELNRILPMVRKTIEKERKINELEDKRDKNENELEKIKQVIYTLEGMPQVFEFSSTLKKSLGEKKINSEIEAQNKRKNELIESINTYNAEIDELTNQWELETKLYRSITSVIATDDGFLSSEEIQVEFIPEYLYLLVIDTSFNKKFTLERFIKEDSMNSFLELIRTNISNLHANTIADSLEYGLFDKTMYFQLFLAN